MSDRCCGPDPADVDPPSPVLTRRRVLTAGAVTGAVVAFGGLPALGQTGSASSSDGDDAGATSTTTTTTTPREPITGEPVHPDDGTIPEAADSFDTLLSESPNRGIMWPMLGRPNSTATWSDTYGACRSGCSRRHQGQDLIAPQMTKMLAVVSGTIVELRHRSSGNSLYIRGDDGWFYCYLHINDERPGSHSTDNRVDTAWGPKLRRFATGTHSMNEAAARGFRVERGDLVAYNGDSGNAEGTYHLHFEIRKPASGTYSSETQRMWSSASVNPRESLRNAAPAVERATVDPATFTPWTSSAAFIAYQFQGFLGRNASASDTSYYSELLNYGTQTPDWLMRVLLSSTECDSKTQCVARLYQAFYKRRPDSDGFRYWLEMRRHGGWSVHRMAEQFSKAPEFRNMYGSLSNAAYVDLVYRNVLGRAPEAEGLAFWTAELDSGRMNRGRMMTHVSESPENKRARTNEMHVIAAYGVMLDRMPTASEHSTWKGILDDGHSTSAMIGMLRHSDEYAAVVAR